MKPLIPKRRKRGGKNPLRGDPSRTATIQRAMLAELRRRFGRVKRAVLDLVRDEDAFGLTANAVEVPDVRQRDHYSCGAASSMSVGLYFSVGPKTLDAWKRLLGTDVEESTRPDAIVEVFRGLGCDVRVLDGAIVEDLAECTSRGTPVICPVQDYGPRVPEGARFEYGHYMVVIGVTDGYVICQDPSEDNVVAGGDTDPLSKTGSVQAPGRIVVRIDDWERIWHDKDEQGRKYVRYGIAVGAPAVQNRFQFHRDARKIEEFQGWLRTQFAGVLDQQLWDAYARRGYERGAKRAYDDTVAKQPIKGDRDEFLRHSFAQPVAKEKVEFLAGRTFDEVQGVTDATAVRLSRTLSDSLVAGESPREAARDLAEDLDWGLTKANAVARTELIRTHAEGQLDMYENLGVDELGVMAEWLTAGDDKVCPECDDLEGEVFTVDEARGMLPLHPNCRCAWIPAGPPTENAFCPTGAGGGVDPTCSPGGVPSQGQPTPPPPGPAYRPSVRRDANGDGVTDAARVGVPAFSVPPPPPIGRIPNLTEHERAVESAFIDHYEANPDKVAADFRAVVARVTKPGDPPTFGTDDAKVLAHEWGAEPRSANRATLNIALHQAANAIAKRAFLQHLDTLKPGDEVMVTVGGCGAGKGYALKNVPQALEMKQRSKAVWDSAGDQNATENPWVQKEVEKRGLVANYVYVHADPKQRWADPNMGVVKRAGDPNDGRMVDAKVFADSYAIGAKNHEAFHEANKDNPHANFTFLDATGQPKLMDGIPKEATTVDARALEKFARRTVQRSDAPIHVKVGATMGARIWA